MRAESRVGFHWLSCGSPSLVEVFPGEMRKSFYSLLDPALVMCNDSTLFWPPDSILIQFSSVQSLSRVLLFATPWTAAHQASLSITNSQSLLKLMSIELGWCHPTISSSVIHFSSCLQSFPASGSFPMSQFFTSGGQSIGVSASALVLPMNLQDWFPQDWLAGSPCRTRDSQESSPTPQFKSINSSALSFLYGPNLTSIHDHRKNHSFD